MGMRLAELSSATGPSRVYFRQTLDLSGPCAKIYARNIFWVEVASRPEDHYLLEIDRHH
jgi:hypothetical protein